MKTLAALCIAAAAAAAPFAPAHAGCRWTWDCSSGTCRQVQLCDSTIDLPAIRPPAIPPVVLPSVRPVEPPTLAPLGTRHCEQRYICDGSGQCRWRTVCE